MSKPDSNLLLTFPTLTSKSNDQEQKQTLKSGFQSYSKISLQFYCSSVFDIILLETVLKMKFMIQNVFLLFMLCIANAYTCFSKH